MLPTLYSYWGIGELNGKIEIRKTKQKEKTKEKEKTRHENVRTLYLQSFG
jgi:hypothetical protein